EERHRHSHLPLVRHDLLDRTVEVRKRTLGDLDSLPNEEGDLLSWLLGLCLVDNAEQPVHFVRAERHWRPLLAHELQYTLNGVDHVGRLLIPYHFEENVPREQLSLDVHLLPVLDLHHFLSWHQRLPDQSLVRRDRICIHPALNKRPDLVLVAGRRLNRVPAMVHGQTPANSAGSHCMNTERKPTSIIAITPPTISDRIITPVESWRTCGQSGQVTLLISATTSR